MRWYLRYGRKKGREEKDENAVGQLPSGLRDTAAKQVGSWHVPLRTCEEEHILEAMLWGRAGFKVRQR